MPPPPRIPPPPARRSQQRPTQPARREMPGDVEEVVIDDPSALPRPPRRGEYDFLPEEPRQRPGSVRRPPEDTWDDDYGYEDETPPDDRRG